MLAYVLLLLFPYVVFAFIVFAFHGGHPRLSSREQGILIITFFVVFFLLLALRAESVGVDLWNYLKKYHGIAMNDFSRLWRNRSTVDFGYGLLNKLLATLGIGDRWFIAIMAALTVFPLGWLYYKETDNWALTISLFIILPIFTMPFSGYRQALAIAIGPLQYHFAKKRNLVGFLLAVLLAYCFHTTAIFMLLLYPAYQAKIKKFWLLWLIPIMAAMFAFNRYIYTFTARMMGGKFEERYGEVTETGAYTMLILFILFAVVSFVIPDEKKMTREDFALRNLLLVTVIFQFFAPVNSIAMRLNYYYLVFVPISVPRMLALSKVKYRKFAILAGYVMVIAFTVYFLYKAYRGKDTMRIFPYSFYWSRIE